MCLIDFGMPVGQDDPVELSYGPNLPMEEYEPKKNEKLKQKRKDIKDEIKCDFSRGLLENGKPKSTDQECKPPKNQNFDFFVFREQALFVGHLTENSLLVVEKSWQEVRKKFGAPVHRHVFGT